MTAYDWHNDVDEMHRRDREKAEFKQTMDSSWELPEAERKALPAKFHQPIWDGLGVPHSWICAQCWGEDWVSTWPCEIATTGGLEVAKASGLGYRR